MIKSSEVKHAVKHQNLEFLESGESIATSIRPCDGGTDGYVTSVFAGK